MTKTCCYSSTERIKFTMLDVHNRNIDSIVTFIALFTIKIEKMQRGIPGNRKKGLLDSPFTMISEKTNLHIYVYFRIISLYQVDGQI